MAQETTTEALDLDACVDNLVVYVREGDARSCRDIALAVLRECQQLRNDLAVNEGTEDARLAATEIERDRWRERYEEQLGATRALDDRRMREIGDLGSELKRLRGELRLIAATCASTAAEFDDAGATNQAHLLRLIAGRILSTAKE